MIDRRTALKAVVGSSACICAGASWGAPLDTVLNVKAFAQTKAWSCWAAAAVMLLQWKNSIPFTEAQVAKMAGKTFEDAFNNDTGLMGGEIANFAQALGLKTEAPQNFTATGYHNLLRAHGPLWIGSRLDAGSSKSRRHIRVLRGITGDGTSDGSTAWVLDPDKGKDFQVNVTQFAKQLEEIAKEEISAGNQLFPQVIRFP